MKSRWAVIVIPCAVIVGIALLWKLTPLAGLVEPDRLAAGAQKISDSPFAPAIAALLFALASLAMVPLLILITATALVFKPALAIPICLTGALIGSAVLYLAGAKFVRTHADRAFGPTLQKVRGALESRGVVAIATLRMVPVTHFALFNVAAGSIGVRFSDYMFGTLLGLAPGTILLCLFGHEIKALWQNPTVGSVLGAVAVVAAWIALALLLQRFLSRRRR